MSVNITPRVQKRRQASSWKGMDNETKQNWIIGLTVGITAIVAVSIGVTFAYVPMAGNGNANGNTSGKQQQPQPSPQDQQHGKTESGGGGVIEVDEQGLRKFLHDGNGPCVVAFVGDGCHHCTEMKPKYEKAAEEAALPFLVVPDRGAGGLLDRYSVVGFPTVMRLSKGGERLAEHAGARTVESYIKFGS